MSETYWQRQTYTTLERASIYPPITQFVSFWYLPHGCPASKGLRSICLATIHSNGGEIPKSSIHLLHDSLYSTS